MIGLPGLRTLGPRRGSSLFDEPRLFLRHATKDLLAQLLELNLTVAALGKQSKPVTAPGIPPSYSNSQKLVTNDCIRP